MDSNLLHRALTEEDASLFRSIPHTDLHCHGMQSAPFRAFCELSLDIINPPPKSFATFEDFDAYLRCNIAPLITSIASVRHVVRAALEKLIREGVVYTEMSFDLTIPDHVGVSLDAYLDMIEEEKNRVADNVDICLEVGLDRSIHPDKLLRLFRRAVERNMFGSVDLYGDELSTPIDRFVQIYRLATSHGLKRKAHLGEFGTSDVVSTGVKTLDLQAVQHGITAADDPSVMDMLAERGTFLNICPASNMALRYVRDLSTYPIQRLLRHGVPITVNSDDYSIFGESVGDQLISLYKTGLCSESDVSQLIANGLKQKKS